MTRWHLPRWDRTAIETAAALRAGDRAAERLSAAYQRGTLIAGALLFGVVIGAALATIVILWAQAY